MRNARSQVTVTEETRKGSLRGSTVEHLRYLSPRRYFRFYMLYLREEQMSCWLPEGFNS